METIGIVVFDGVDDLDLVGVASVLGKAKVCNGTAGGLMLIPTTECDSVTTGAGLKIENLGCWKDAARCCALVFPSGAAAVEAEMAPAFASAARRAANSSTLLCSICSGAFLLSKLGLLAGHHVAVHAKHRSLIESLSACHAHNGFVKDGALWSIGGMQDSGYPKSIAMGIVLLEHFWPGLVEDVLARLELPKRRVDCTTPERDLA